MKTFSEFWPFYLRQHSLGTTRALHFAGSTGGLLIAMWGLVTLRWEAIPAALALGYGLSWIGHFAFERNRPATFKRPLWSFLGDWKMWGLIVSGGMDTELDRLGIVPVRASEAAPWEPLFREASEPSGD